MPIEVTWLGHASFRLACADGVVYIDPWKLSAAGADGDLVIVSHSHYDHCSPDDVAKVSTKAAVVVAPADAAAKLRGARAVAPGQRIEAGKLAVETLPAYNIDKAFHPRANGWIGAVVVLQDKRIYYAGDSDRIPEMARLERIDLALLPVGGTYTMDAVQAAQACRDIGCRLAVPYHWGDIVGSRADAERFVAAVESCQTRLLQPGQSLTL